MNSSRQLLLGTSVFIGGGVLLFAMLLQGNTAETTRVSNVSPVEITDNSDPAQSQDKPLKTLTADVETEERILAEKKLQRESKIAELDKRAKEFLSEQERAEALAMEKARLENEKYRTNAIEPVMDEPVTPSSAAVAKPTVQSRPAEPIQTTGPATESTTSSTTTSSTVSQASTSSQQNNPVQTSVQARSIDSTSNEPESTPPKKSPIKTETAEASNNAPSSAREYTVKPGDGLIKIARRYNLPVEALSKANNLSSNAELRLGQTLTIPSASQAQRLSAASEDNEKTAATAKNQASNATKNSSTVDNNKTDNSKPKVDDKPEASSSSAPTRPLSYEVKRGDGLIKLARQYNVPVEALAEANNMSTNSALNLGQTLTIPSRRQVARLQREAEQKKKDLAAKRSAQKRLAEARRKAQQGEAKGKFGVQVALANNQQKADEIVKKMRAAGYSASTSETDKGVRVIVGPEQGKDAALALKDKINADSRTGVNKAWVLYWR